MSRINPGEPQYVRPGLNVYTGLALAACLAEALALFFLFIKANDVIGGSLFQ